MTTPQVLMLDRGCGKTTAIVDSILGYEFPPGIPGIIITPTSHDTHVLNMLANSGCRVGRFSVQVPTGRVDWRPATSSRGRESLRGLDPRTPVWMDDADRTLYGATDPFLLRLALVLVTATPTPRMYQVGDRGES